jgi:hypothetical protein
MPQSRFKPAPQEGPHAVTDVAKTPLDDLFSRAVTEAREPGPAHEQITTAVVQDISADGVARVVLSGDSQACDASSLLHYPSPTAASDALLGRTVLVLVSPMTLPVILGIVAQRLWDAPEGSDGCEAQATLPTGTPLSVQLDKRRLDLEASDEIRLSCGKSSLLLRRDGTVIIRGVTIVSRASQANKIRGATISLN